MFGNLKHNTSSEYLILISGKSPPNCLHTKTLALLLRTIMLIREIYIYIYIYNQTTEPALQKKAMFIQSVALKIPTYSP